MDCLPACLHGQTQCSLASSRLIHQSWKSFRKARQRLLSPLLFVIESPTRVRRRRLSRDEGSAAHQQQGVRCPSRYPCHARPSDATRGDEREARRARELDSWLGSSSRAFNDSAVGSTHNTSEPLALAFAAPTAGDCMALNSSTQCPRSPRLTDQRRRMTVTHRTATPPLPLTTRDSRGLEAHPSTNRAWIALRSIR